MQEMQNRMTPEEWKDAKEAERKQLMDQQDQAITAAVSNGPSLVGYLTGRGRLGSHFSTGNAALILAQNPKARIVKSLEGWGEVGRRVSRGEHGIPIIGKDNGYWRVTRVFELAQTYGMRPCRIFRLENMPDELDKALRVLENFSPVEITSVGQMDAAVRYDAAANEIQVRAGGMNAEVFQPLAAAIVEANIALAQESPEPAPLAKLYAECTSIELCGRFGMPVPENSAQKLEPLLPLFELGEERNMLSEIGDFARQIGDEIERTIQPPLRTQTRAVAQPAAYER